MAVRYSLLGYMYTLFYHAHTKGETVMRALAWEFPNDESLRETYNQFMLGPSILVTPVLIPNVETVQGVFPGIGLGERWYDWYTLTEVDAEPGENVTLQAPLEHINVHVRGGAVLVLQEPKLTTAETTKTPYSLLVALDSNSAASGDLYLDDGESLQPNATRLVQVSCPTQKQINVTKSSHSSRTVTTAFRSRLMARSKVLLYLVISPLLDSTSSRSRLRSRLEGRTATLLS